MSSLYRLMNDDVKRWWYFRQLRDHGATKEARQKERQSILSSLKTWRQVIADKGYLRLGEFGSSLHYKNGTLSGFDPELYITVARRLGVPIIDCREMLMSERFKAINFPLIAIGREPDREPWHVLSYAPLAYVADLYRQAGAIVENI